MIKAVRDNRVHLIDFGLQPLFDGGFGRNFPVKVLVEQTITFKLER